MQTRFTRRKRATLGLLPAASANLTIHPGNLVTPSNRRPIKSVRLLLALTLLSIPAFADLDLTGIAANPTDLSHLVIGQQFEVDFYASSITSPEYILSEGDMVYWDGSHATLDSWQTLGSVWSDLSTNPLVVQAFFTATAVGTGSAELELNAATTAGSFDVFSNGVPFTVTAVPELSSIRLLLTLLAMAGLVIAVRRRVRGRPDSIADR